MNNANLPRMLYYRSLFFSAFLMLSLLSSAQQFTRKLNWKNNRTYTSYEGKRYNAPYFEGCQPDATKGFIPYYEELIPLSQNAKVSASLSNVAFSEATVTSDVNQLNNSPEVNIYFIKKHPYAGVRFPAIQKSANGNWQKLESFTIQLEVTPVAEKRGLRTYAANSVLSSGNWWKVGVSNSGVYKLDYDFLKNQLQLDLNNMALTNLAVFGNGSGMVAENNATPRYDDLQEINSFVYDANNNNRCDPGDFLLFYAAGPHVWKYNSSTLRFEHQFNLYSDKAFYFITPDRGSGKRITSMPSAASPNVFLSDFDDYAFHESDEYSLLGSGRLWFGDRMSSINPNKSFSFDFPNLNTGVPIFVKSRVAANSPYNSTISITVNGQALFSQNIGNISPNAYPDMYHDNTALANFTSGSSNLTFNYTFSNPDGSGSSLGYIDYLEINLKRMLQMSGSQVAFRAVASVGASNITQFNIGNFSGSMQVWDITDQASVNAISGSLAGNQFNFAVATPTLKEFVAVDPSGSFSNPEKIEKVENQNLHAIGQPDMVIVTSPALVDAANDLAAFHRANDNLSVKVVLTQQIYNEFSGGRLDIGGIRDFAKMMYDRAGADSSLFPEYFCLFGDGSYDPKDRVPDNNNVVPTYESEGSQNLLASYVSDDFFGCLDDGESGNMDAGNNKLDIAVGRIAVADNAEAQGVVNKIRLYKSTASLGNWRNIITMIGDDEDYNTHQEEANHLADFTQTNYPAYNTEKIFCDAFQQITTAGGDRYPDVNTAILNRINNGTLAISYTGHGGVNNWAHERIFNMSDIKNLDNKEKLPLFITATCDFTAFDNPGYKTAGEFLLTNANGGGIALITTTRPVYSDANNALQDALFLKLFEPYRNRKPTLGELLARTKNDILGSISTINTRCFVLVGDPALKLNYPEWNVVTTKINNVSVALPHDTLKALKQVTISGEVRDNAGNKLTSFNGTCYPLVYDKLSSFTTLANDPSTSIKATYSEYKNILFKGKCSVLNGDFQFTFIVPKDINYQVGNGRISYYADNGNSTDAHGYQNDLVIGGTADSFAADNEGPKIKLFMNDEKFVFGGMTNESPKMLVRLRDQSGINTTGNGLGHDLTAILDLNSKNPIILNNYYETDKDSFRTGKVLYPFSKLGEGRHNLRVKAWDIHNNSAEDYTEFVVSSSAKLALNHVLNYPNPFTTHTNFMFEHNRPGDILSIQIQIYTISGRLVKTIMRDEVPMGYRIDDLSWDGLDDYGDKIGKGTYVYKVHVHDSQGNSANKFERLVVLR
ncbi:MAG: type IX secretion system sortase PorU [Chitinophagales bacterium]